MDEDGSNPEGDEDGSNPEGDEDESNEEFDVIELVFKNLTRNLIKTLKVLMEIIKNDIITVSRKELNVLDRKTSVKRLSELISDLGNDSSKDSDDDDSDTMSLEDDNDGTQGSSNSMIKKRTPSKDSKKSKESKDP